MSCAIIGWTPGTRQRAGTEAPPLLSLVTRTYSGRARRRRPYCHSSLVPTAGGHGGAAPTVTRHSYLQWYALDTIRNLQSAICNCTRGNYYHYAPPHDHHPGLASPFRLQCAWLVRRSCSTHPDAGAAYGGSAYRGADDSRAGAGCRG